MLFSGDVCIVHASVCIFKSNAHASLIPSVECRVKKLWSSRIRKLSNVCGTLQTALSRHLGL